MSEQLHESLIRRVLGANYLELALERITFDETAAGEATVRVTVLEGATPVVVEGKGVGVVAAMHAGLLDRYAREYQSLRTLQVVTFEVAADIATKQGPSGVDAIGRVRLDVENSEGHLFSFPQASRSVNGSIARAILAMVQHFVNAERAFLTLYNARRDALERGREDLVSRYTAELAEVVESTSYADVIANIRKELG